MVGELDVYLERSPYTKLGQFTQLINLQQDVSTSCFVVSTSAYRLTSPCAVTAAQYVWYISTASNPLMVTFAKVAPAK